MFRAGAGSGKHYSLRAESRLPRKAVFLKNSPHTKSRDLKLRAHHILCIEFFEGKGYSDEFVREMKGIIKKLNTDNPDIVLSAGCDIICKACPNNADGRCADEQKVCGFDQRCMQALGVKCGEKLKYSELRSLAFEKVIYKNEIKHICGGCEWSKICHSACRNYNNSRQKI